MNEGRAIDHSRVYDNSEAFFEMSGSAVMQLNAEAARNVCLECIRRNIVVMGIEGGIWRNPGFEARIDCLWGHAVPPLSQDELKQNNLAAARYISEMSVAHDGYVAHDAFILTTLPNDTGLSPEIVIPPD